MEKFTKMVRKITCKILSQNYFSVCGLTDPNLVENGENEVGLQNCEQKPFLNYIVFSKLNGTTTYFLGQFFFFYSNSFVQIVNF